MNTAISNYKENGIGVWEDFIPESKCLEIIEEMKKLVSEAKLDSTNSKAPKSIFSTQEESHEDRGEDQNFIKSSEDISFFWEENAFDENGKLKFEPIFCLNKVGHALHTLNGVFKDLIFSEKAKSLFRELKWENPMVPQSMFIFKQPKIGGEVTPHMDSTFLYNENLPGDGLLGLWLALEDATVENGCLQFVPKSHKTIKNVPRRFARVEGSDPVKVVMEGQDPVFEEKDWVMAPVKKGSLVLIHGKVMHRSFKNVSESSRNIITWHCVEGGKGCKWSEKNWLQYTGGEKNFPSYF